MLALWEPNRPPATALGPGHPLESMAAARELEEPGDGHEIASKGGEPKAWFLGPADMSRVPQALSAPTTASSSII